MGSSQRCDLNTVTVVGEAAEAQSEDSDDEELREARERRALVVSRWRRAYAHVLELARLGFAGDFGSGAYIEVDLRGGKTLPPQVERKLRREYRGRVEVQVVDYCLTAARPRLVRWSNYSDGATGMRALRGFLDMPRPVLSLLEPQIRWVKAEGFAWDLVKALAGRYNLPPLLVSDLLGVENTEVLENFGGGSGGGGSDPGPAPGGAGGFDGTWASGTSMPRGRATARSGLMGRRSRNAPAQLLSRSSQLGSGSWEKSGGVYGGGNAGDGIGGGGTGGGGGSGGSGAAGCGAWWRWGRSEKEEEPQLEDPHRRIKTEYYGSDGILYISMPMIGLRTRLLLRSTTQQQQAAAAAARAELDPAPAPTAAAAAGPTVHGARVKVEAAGKPGGPASNAVSRALEATIAAAMRPSGGGFGGMPVAEGVEAPSASDPAAAAVASAAEAASTAGNTSAQALQARPLAPASTSVFAQNPLMSFAAAGVDPATVAASAGHVGASSGDGGHAGLTDLGAAAAPAATRAGAATTHVTATAAGTCGPLAGAAGAALVTGASAGAAPAMLMDTGTGTAAGRHHGAGGVGVGVGVAVGSGDVGVSSLGHPQHHPGHVHHHGHGGQRRSSELQGWGSVASGGSVADVGVETDSPRSLEAWLRWLRGLCRCGRPQSRGRKDAGLWQRLMGVRRSRDDEYRYEKRWVEEPLVLMLVQDKAVHGATPHAPPNLPLAAGPAIAAGGGVSVGGGGHGTGARGVTLISLFHYSGRSVTYRLWRQITSGATGSTAAAAAAAAAVAAAATAASFSHTKSGHHSAKSAAETPKSAVAVATAATGAGVTAGGTAAALPPHPPGVGADAGGRGGVPSGLTPQLLNRISTSTIAGSSHSLLSEVRRSDAGYLLYLIMRGAVDQAYDVVRDFYAQLSEFERRVRSGNLSATATEQLHVMSTDLQLLDRRFKATITVLRLLTTKDAKDDSGTLTDAPMQLSANTQAKIKALVEQVRGISDEIDSLGTQASQLTDLVFNLIAHRSNNSMRVLSIISTVFLPITFLAGVYGTNFDNLPELHWQLGYMYFWLLMTGVGIVVLAIANKYVH